MPYVLQSQRDALVPVLEKVLEAAKVMSSGELNYAITKILLARLSNTKTPRYEDYNSIIGVLENVKLEMYRRKVAIYEQEKITENGDVY